MEGDKPRVYLPAGAAAGENSVSLTGAGAGHARLPAAGLGNAIPNPTGAAQAGLQPPAGSHASGSAFGVMPPRIPDARVSHGGHGDAAEDGRRAALLGCWGETEGGSVCGSPFSSNFPPLSVFWRK